MTGTSEIGAVSAERMAAWERELADAAGDWTVLDPKDWESFATKFEKQDDGSLLGGGDIQTGDGLRITTETQLTNITGFRLEALVNHNLAYGGPGLLGKGSFLLREFTVAATSLENPSLTNLVKFTRALADMEAPGFGITNAIGGNTDKGGWTAARTPDHRNREHRAVFECAEPLGFPGGTRLNITLHQRFKPSESSGGLDADSALECHMLGCVRLSVTTNVIPLKVDPFSPDEHKLLAIPASDRSTERIRELFDRFRLVSAPTPRR